MPAFPPRAALPRARLRTGGAGAGAAAAVAKGAREVQHMQY